MLEGKFVKYNVVLRLFRMYLLLLYFSLIFGFISYGQQVESKAEYLFRFYDENSDRWGYKNNKGEIVIGTERYTVCYTDTLKTYAIVAKKPYDIVVIDKNENILHHIFSFDNHPDYSADGLFRIIKDNKIGFVDKESGEIVIKPQFDCAYPFEDGLAKVSNECQSIEECDYTRWVSNNWFYIDKTGKRVETPSDK